MACMPHVETSPLQSAGYISLPPLRVNGNLTANARNCKTCFSSLRASIECETRQLIARESAHAIFNQEEL